MLKKNSLIIMIFLMFTFTLIFNKTYDIQALDNIQFKRLTIEDGLSQSSPEVIIQDSKGYIWLGTNDGLDRYDGREFRSYKIGDGITEELSNSYITSLMEDKNGNIWVGSIDGLSKLNPNTDRIVNYKKQDKKISNNVIVDILSTKNGQLLVTTLDGINLYNEEANTFDRILNSASDLCSQKIYGIDEDEYGNIWIGTDKGLHKVNINDKNIKCYHYDDEKLNEEVVYEVYCDKNGYVWVGTINHGLHRLNILTKEITSYKNDENNDRSLPNNFVRTVLRDSYGTIWVGTDDGLAKLIDGTDEFIVYKNDESDSHSLSNNKVCTIIEDKRGIIWVGTYVGVSMFDPSNSIKYYKKNIMDENSLSSNIIHGIFEDKNGLIWVGTADSGVNIVDLNNKTIEHLDKNDGLTNNRIRSITGDENYIWIATSAGLNRIDIKTKNITQYKEYDDNVRTIYLDSKGYLWIGTMKGVNILNTKTTDSIDLSAILKQLSINDKYIESIYEDSEGNYWLGTFLDGNLIKLDIKNNKIENYTKRMNKPDASSNSIRVITEHNDNMWIGTNEGLWKFDKSKDIFKYYGKDDGLSNGTIYGILIDKDDNPWVSTNYGISKLDIKENKFINFTVSDGLQGNEFNSEAYCKLKNGDMVFGGLNGMNILDPQKLTINESANKVEFNEFVINGDYYKDISDLKFSYNNNSILIKFFLPDYRDTKSTTYYYKIEGRDENWNVSKNNEILYKNLMPGKYTLKVKAKNYHGVMSEENSISFTIKYPVLLSPLAFIVYIILLIVFISNNSIRVKQLDKLVNKRTKELRLEMEKNKELFDKVITLEKSKNKYFVNLSHELRTPLNVISATLQLIKEYNKKDEEMTKDKIEYHTNIMQKNTNRLLNLINNIIDNSKIEHGNYKINIKEDDIVYIVEETVLTLKDYIEEKGINLIIDPEVEEKIVNCDRHEIERCIVNLVSNAYKFTPEGGTIEVKIKDLGDEVEIYVKDDGIGIDKEYQKYIFDRFNQVIDDQSEVKGGSGLGLTITKNIVEMHKGNISVESELHKGSKFIIKLPAKVGIGGSYEHKKSEVK